MWYVQLVDPAGELHQLDKIVQSSDCLLTVIHDPDWKDWVHSAAPSRAILTLEECCKASSWHHYLSRAWCRVEMLYGTYVPLRSYNDTERISKFAGGLRCAFESGRRAHFLYGTKESKCNLWPSMLPPLQHSSFNTYNPATGILTNAPDRDKIVQLMNELQPYMRRVQYGYSGDRNHRNERHGFGRFITEHGLEYEGQWSNNLCHGECKIKWPSGDVYIGQVTQGKVTGRGTVYFGNGMIQEGQWLNGIMHGDDAHVIYSSGLRYRGSVIDGKVTGYGSVKFPSGMEFYSGKWVNGNGELWSARGCCYAVQFFSCVCYKGCQHRCGPIFSREDRFDPRTVLDDTNWNVMFQGVLKQLTCGAFGSTPSSDGQGFVVYPVQPLEI